MRNRSPAASSPAEGDDVLFTRECHYWRAGYSIVSLGLVVSPGVFCSGSNLQAIDAQCGNAEGGRIKGPELIQWHKSSIAPVHRTSSFPRAKIIPAQICIRDSTLKCMPQRGAKNFGADGMTIGSLPGRPSNSEKALMTTSASRRQRLRFVCPSLDFGELMQTPEISRLSDRKSQKPLPVPTSR
jgi:hypothetical protein